MDKFDEITSRKEKRKLKRDTRSIVKKAKIDMENYLLSLNGLPSEQEVRAWQAGYIAGINRGSNNQ
jgi:hypothetical protein